MRHLGFKVLDDSTGAHVGQASLASDMLESVAERPIDGLFAVIAPNGNKVAELQISISFDTVPGGEARSPAPQEELPKDTSPASAHKVESVPVRGTIAGRAAASAAYADTAATDAAATMYTEPDGAIGPAQRLDLRPSASTTLDPPKRVVVSDPHAARARPEGQPDLLTSLLKREFAAPPRASLCGYLEVLTVPTDVVPSPATLFPSVFFQHLSARVVMAGGERLRDQMAISAYDFTANDAGHRGPQSAYDIDHLHGGLDAAGDVDAPPSGGLSASAAQWYDDMGTLQYAALDEAKS